MAKRVLYLLLSLLYLWSTYVWWVRYFPQWYEEDDSLVHLGALAVLGLTYAGGVVVCLRNAIRRPKPKPQRQTS